MNQPQLPSALAAWLRSAIADAERRGLPELKPLLEALAHSTAALRQARWNESPAPEPQGRVD